MTIGDEKTSSTETSPLQQALVQVERLVGRKNISLSNCKLSENDSPRRNVSLFRPRDVCAVVRPDSVEDFQELVRIFNNAKTNVGLHAESTRREIQIASHHHITNSGTTLSHINFQSNKGNT